MHNIYNPTEGFIWFWFFAIKTVWYVKFACQNDASKLNSLLLFRDCANLLQIFFWYKNLISRMNLSEQIFYFLALSKVIHVKPSACLWCCLSRHNQTWTVAVLHCHCAKSAEDKKNEYFHVFHPQKYINWPKNTTTRQ